MSFSIVLPLAGLSSRMRCAGPKCLIKIGRETVLGRQLRLIKEIFPRVEIVAVLGWGAEQIEPYLPRGTVIVRNNFYETSGTSYSVALGLSACSNDRTLVVYGDLIFNRPVISRLTSRLNEQSSWAIVERNISRKGEVGVSVANGEVTSLAHGLDLLWSHILFLDRPEKELFFRQALLTDHRRLFTYEVLNRVIAHGGHIGAITPPDSRLVELDRPEDLHLLPYVLR